jgi:hypothetical protein
VSIAKLAGLYVERKERGAPGEFADIEAMSADEVREYIRKDAEALGFKLVDAEKFQPKGGVRPDASKNGPDQPPRPPFGVPGLRPPSAPPSGLCQNAATAHKSTTVWGSSGESRINHLVRMRSCAKQPN